MSSTDVTEQEKVTHAVREAVSTQIEGLRDGLPSVYSCPDCGGVLWQIEAGGQMEFRCHVGHVLSAQSLLEQQVDLLEASLWTAVRVLSDRDRLLSQLTARAREDGDVAEAERLSQLAAVSRERGDALKSLIKAGV